MSNKIFLNKKMAYSLIGVSVLFFLVFDFLIQNGSMNFEFYSIAIIRVAKYLYFLMLFIIWGGYICYRVVNSNDRLMMTLLTISIVIELAFDFAKDMLIFDMELIKNLWYAGFVPEYLIPMLFCVLAMEKGESDSSRSRIEIFFCITILCVIAILTNDMHNKVFQLHYLGSLWLGTYTYKTGFFFVYCWAIFCYGMGILTLIKKTRKNEVKKYFWIPMMLGIILLLYTSLFVLGFIGSGVVVATGDPGIYIYTIVLSIIEAMLSFRFMSSNSSYGKFFLNSSVAMKIEDDAGVVSFLSYSYSNNNVKTIEHAVRGGKIILEEDVAELNSLYHDLDLRNKELTLRNEFLKKHGRISKELKAVEYRNRLYSEVESLLAEKMQMVIEMVNSAESLGAASDSARELLKKVGVLITYIKRKCNFVLISKKYKFFSVSEIKLAFEESLKSIELLNVSCGFVNTSSISLVRNDIAMVIFDWYEELVEIFNEFNVSSFAINLLGNHVKLKLVVFIDLYEEPQGLSKIIFSRNIQKRMETLSVISSIRREEKSFVISFELDNNGEGQNGLFS